MSLTDKPEFPPLFPAGLHVVDLPELRSCCVDRFALSATRRGIMNGLETLAGILDTLGIRGELWIDGSFLTEKIDPADVDLVLRADFDCIGQLSEARHGVLEWWASKAARDYGCDTYIFVEFPEGHPDHTQGADLRRYWLKWFGASRSGVPKGIASVSLPLRGMRNLGGVEF